MSSRKAGSSFFSVLFSVALVVPLGPMLIACDGTVTGIGRIAPPPETPLPPAPVESARPRGQSPEGNRNGDPWGSGEPPPSESEGTGPRRIAAQHLLVMYKGSQRAPANIDRTREQARARADEALRRARAGEDFGKLVAEFSDEPEAAKRRGDLGLFTRDQMVKPFSDAAFALDVGQLSSVVETPFGFHVIKRTE